MLRTFLSWHGRIGRKTFWITTLWSIMFLITLAIISRLIAGAIPILWIPLILIFLVCFYCVGIVVPIKRLHDRDRTGAWILMYIFGIILTIAVLSVTLWFGVFSLDTRGDAMGPEIKVLVSSPTGAVILAIFSISQLILSIISVWLCIEIGFFKGTKGPNRFGEDPLAK